MNLEMLSIHLEGWVHLSRVVWSKAVHWLVFLWVSENRGGAKGLPSTRYTITDHTPPENPSSLITVIKSSCASTGPARDDLPPVQPLKRPADAQSTIDYGPRMWNGAEDPGWSAREGVVMVSSRSKEIHSFGIMPSCVFQSHEIFICISQSE